MSAIRRYYYLRDNSFTNSIEADSMFFTESSSNNNNNNIDNKDDKEFDDSELLPGSSSSLDRSSVGSIPWADDAIKKNQLLWERVERLLANEEQPSSDETELAQEISEWQQKFPQLLTNYRKEYQSFQMQNSFDSSRTNFDESLDIDTLSNASLDSEDGFVTPTAQLYDNSSTIKKQIVTPQLAPRQSIDSMVDLAQLLGRNLRISSVPLSWRQRQNFAKSFTLQSEISDPPTPPPPPPPRRQFSPINAENKTRARMPPLLNVLDSKRRFRGLSNNRSFVQLSQPQPESNRIKNRAMPWQVPMAAASMSSRLVNNRNSVILPAINLERIMEHRSLDGPNSASSSTSLTPNRSLNEYHRNQQQPAYYFQKQYVPRRQYMGSNISSTPSTGGRSISAAVHNPRFEFNAFYLPYSAATKFKSFNKI